MNNDSTFLIDPLLRIHRRGRWIGGLGLFMVLGAACWTFAPVRVDDPTSAETIATLKSAVDADSQPLVIDREAFKVSLWVDPLVESFSSLREPVPEQNGFRFQLIGIQKVGTLFKGVLYDPSEDRLHVVGAGEKLHAVLVEQVERDFVKLVQGDRAETLSRAADQ